MLCIQGILYIIVTNLEWGSMITWHFNHTTPFHSTVDGSFYSKSISFICKSNKECLVNNLCSKKKEMMFQKILAMQLVQLNEMTSPQMTCTSTTRVNMRDYGTDGTYWSLLWISTDDKYTWWHLKTSPTWHFLHQLMYSCTGDSLIFQLNVYSSSTIEIGYL